MNSKDHHHGTLCLCGKGYIELVEYTRHHTGASERIYACRGRGRDYLRQEPCKNTFTITTGKKFQRSNGHA